jgi:deazaflavin-dependent oxidoreductase (nitroreductase family)
MPRFERVMRRLTRGRLTAGGLLMPALVLYTVGGRTGEPRRTELMCVPDGDAWLVTGSNYGGPSHPGWTWNLLAHPNAAIEVRGRRVLVHASLVPDAERERAWATLERQWPGYRGYEVTAHRTLRIFRLTPR